MKRISVVLLVFCTCFALAAWPQATAQHPQHQYKLYDLGTLGGPNSSTTFFATSLTRQGAIGGAQTAAADPFNPNCLGNPLFPGCYVMHAFRWKGGILTDLGALPGNSGNNGSFTAGINDWGLIVGYSENGSVDPNTGYPEAHAVVWNWGQITDLGTFGGAQSAAMAVNDLGQVVGGALNTTDDPFSAGILWGPDVLAWPGTTQVRAFVWQNGVMRDLGTLGGPDAFAYAINFFGQIAGQSYTSYTPNQDTGIPTVDPFLWDRGKMIDLGTLGGTIGYTWWLNDWGQVTGISNLAGDQVSHGFLWDHGTLNDLLPASGGDYSWGLWINDLGDVVGGSTLPGDQLYHASLWRRGQAIDMGTVGQDACAEAWGANDLGQVVGISYPSPCSGEQTGRAFLWQEGGPMVDLNALVENPSNLYLYVGSYVDDSGDIVAQGVLPNADIHAVLLVPDGYCNKECKQRILHSQNAPVSPAHTGAKIPSFGNPASWLRNPPGQRNAMPSQH